MRILYIFPSFERGGAQLRAISLMQRFGLENHNSIISLNGDDRASDLIGVNVVHEVLKTPRLSGLLPLRLRQIRNLLRRYQPDLLITHNWGSIEWVIGARLSGNIRVLHLEAGFGPDEAAQRLRRRIILRRLALAGRYVHVCVPSHMLSQIAQKEWHLSDAKVSLIADGIECEKFRDAVSGHKKPTSGETTIGTVAILRREKNLGLLLSAFKKLTKETESRLIIVGEGPEREALEQQARDLGLEDTIHFTGFIDAPENAQATFDVFAISSTTEQTPNSVLQAMAAGKPVVGTDVGDIKRMVSTENLPFIVAPGDDNAFGNALQQLISDPQLRSKLGKANQQKAFSMYSVDTMADKYKKLIGRLVEQE